MVYISFPRNDLDSHKSLQAWRDKIIKNEGDWTSLKDFLAEQARFNSKLHRLPKCWYTELPQGDNYALDIEHFRPKNQASPLNKNQIRVIEKFIGFEIFQEKDSGAYPWLEYDYRNYRLTTATPNRAGAKHVYFPIALNSKRLKTGDFPWSKTEYNLLLDPTNKHDSKQLMVLADGKICPRASRQHVSENDYKDLPSNWHSSGFNYIRAWITIVIYRLNERIFIESREEIYRDTWKNIDDLLLCLKSNNQQLIESYVTRLANSILPSAPFSLAAKSALEAYTAPQNENTSIKIAIENAVKDILRRVEDLYSSNVVDWHKP